MKVVKFQIITQMNKTCKIKNTKEKSNLQAAERDHSLSRATSHLA